MHALPEVPNVRRAEGRYPVLCSDLRVDGEGRESIEAGAIPLLKCTMLIVSLFAFNWDEVAWRAEGGRGAKTVVESEEDTDVMAQLRYGRFRIFLSNGTSQILGLGTILSK
jgi:hypothetical protein